MSKTLIPAVAVLLLASIGLAPLTASAPLSASAAAVTTTDKSANTIKVQNMNVTMIFDGVSMQPPTGQYVFMYNNTTYVPVRFMSYALQKSVSWDAKNLKVTVSEPSSTEQVVIKEYLMNATNGNGKAAATKNIVLNNVKASYVFNDTTKELPKGQSSFILNGSLYVPLRFLSESVGNNISWDQKTKTITAVSKAYQEQSSNNSTGNNSKDPSATASPVPNGSGDTAGGGSSGAETGNVTYESITSETEAKLSALRDQSQSTLMGIAFEYIGATDEASKKSIKDKGKQQLASFTASFNSIVAEAEKKLNNNGYSSAIIGEYRSKFEKELQDGLNMAAGLLD